MQVSDSNDIKIYNLSAGRSLPEWLSARKRRALLKKNVDIKRRIELIQDFDMPGVSTTVKVSNDGNYILATGIYKPRIKCFDVNNLSLKFERCFDSEAITFEVLSDDYSKLVFLQCDRYIEFHAAYGRYFRLRIPKFGRDMKYHTPSCDLIVVGASPDIYRLNLERGQFMTPYESAASEINKCAINPIHNLLVCGTQEGRVEAWDPRIKERVGVLDCALACLNEIKELSDFPSITALKFNDFVHMGVGTASGQVLLYDIRSDKPFTVKDHVSGLAIKDVDFHYQQELVYSLDSSGLEIWNQNTRKIYTAIESSSPFNNLCVVPKTGLFFLANENTKIQTYFIPSMGPAPKWASFLDSLTEELEESITETVYDDYKFVTKQELESLGLEHLIGTKLIRAYMHGYFLDVRLYKKAKSVANPFEFEEYRKKKIRETIDKEREARVQLNKLPSVNKELALKLMDIETKPKKNKGEGANLLHDTRFQALFENPDFEVDKNTDEYRLLNPVLSRLDKNKQKELKQKYISPEFEPIHEELEGKNSSEESSEESSADEDEESSDDEHTWTKEVKKQHRIIQREHREKERAEALEKEEAEGHQQPKMYELKVGEEFRGINGLKKKLNKASLGKRIQHEDISVKYLSVGNREMSFSLRKVRDNKIEERNKKHREERKKLLRPVLSIKSKFKSRFNKR
ncbi:nucleolar protein 10 [Euwallacea similis]|uniref:nucleolar protein 10 n=1 Tax=Euwallacea similis TaxID=1736056 RepID=UPI00344E46AC